MPLLEQVVMRKRENIDVYGSDYSTRDGSGCRDFIHIMDIASAHKLALEFCSYTINDQESNYIFNVGSGSGYTVLEMIKMMEKVCKTFIPFQVR